VWIGAGVRYFVYVLLSDIAIGNLIFVDGNCGIEMFIDSLFS